MTILFNESSGNVPLFESEVNQSCKIIYQINAFIFIRSLFLKSLILQ